MYEIKSKLAKWLLLLKNLSQLDEKSSVVYEPEFTKLFEIAEYSELTTFEKIDYDTAEKYGEVYE